MRVVEVCGSQRKQFLNQSNAKTRQYFKRKEENECIGGVFNYDGVQTMYRPTVPAPSVIIERLSACLPFGGYLKHISKIHRTC
jgi:hypothetical protein